MKKIFYVITVFILIIASIPTIKLSAITDRSCNIESDAFESNFELRCSAEAPCAESVSYSIYALVCGTHTLEQVSQRYLSGTLGVVATDYTSFDARRSLGEVVDEYGIFQTKDSSSAKVLCEKLNAALKKNALEWDDRYYASETPKIKNARAITIDCFVLYTVMDANMQREVENKFNELMRR